jgi:hypothetical protein
MEKARGMLVPSANLQYCGDIYELVRNTDAFLILT